MYILVCTSFLACKKEPKRQTVNAGTPPGTIKGVVGLYDENGISIPNAAGVVVSLGGTSISATTQDDGKFTLSNVPTGTYNINISKKDYGYITEQVLVTGNGTLNLNRKKLYHVSSDIIESFTYTGYDSVLKVYNFTTKLKSIVPKVKCSYVIVYSALPDLNATNLEKKLQYGTNFDNCCQLFENGVNKVSMGMDFLGSYSKKTIYMKAFVTVSGSPTVTDQETGKVFYTNFTDPSPEISVKIF